MAGEGRDALRQLFQMGTESPRLKMECLERKPGGGRWTGSCRVPRDVWVGLR